jgi:hypothetical protein
MHEVEGQRHAGYSVRRKPLVGKLEVWVESRVAAGEFIPCPLDTFLKPGSLDGDVKVTQSDRQQLALRHVLPGVTPLVCSSI